MSAVPQKQPPKNYQIAADLAGKGYRVHPLEANEKRPIWKDWPNRASNDVLDALNTFGPTNWNVGIACGTDITVIDADGEDGLAALAALNLPPNTPIVTTPSRCSHAYLRTPPGVMLPNRAKMYVTVNGVGKPLDVRGAGGQVVAPGCSAWSRHAGVAPVFGGYLGELPPIAELPMMPASLAELIGRTVERAKAEWVGGTCGDWRSKIDGALWARIRTEGPDRSKHSFAVFMALFDRGLTDDDAKEVAELEDARFALKYVEREDLDYEIDRVRGEWRDKQVSPAFQEVQPAPGTVPAAVPTTWRDHVTRADDLEHKQFQPVRFVLQGIVPEGLSMLAGRPKLGKSWLGLDMCLAIATGGECLGVRADVGDVLYLALEDNHRRLQRRMRRLKLSSWPARLNLATQWRRLDQGGVADIAEWASSVPKPSLVIIDTFAAVKPITKSKGYEEDYAALAPLHRLAGDRGLGIMVLHHQRKQGADDPLDSISGTLGIAGCIDTPIVLARGPKGTTLYVRGRDVEEAEHGLEFDKATCRWRILGPAADVQRSRERQVVLGALRTSPEPVKVATLVEMTQMQRANLDVLLSKMVQEGEITRPGRGLYTAATGPI